MKSNMHPAQQLQTKNALNAGHTLTAGELLDQERLRIMLEAERHEKRQAQLKMEEEERIKKRGFKVLNNSGLYEAHQDLLRTLFNYGWPTGTNVYEFSALHLLKYERKL